MSILLYLVKASACTLAFYTVYGLFLNRLTFFGLNRWYLLTTMVLSFIIPIMHFSMARQISAGTDVIPDEHLNTGMATIGAAISHPSAVDTAWTVPEILLYGYVVVAVLLGIKLCVSILKLLVLGHKQGMGQHQFTVVKQAAVLHNSSFFHMIFLKNDLDTAEEEVVIKHETEHIKRFHSLDIMLMEIAKVVLWFNPAPYLYRKSMEQVHEYEVDAAVTAQYNRKDYAGMLLKLSGFNAPALVNNFSGSQLNKRVNMLFTKRSKRVKKSLYVFIVPVFAALIWFLCVDRVYAQSILPTNTFTVVIDAGHGGKNTGVVVNGINEKDVVLELAKAVKSAGDANGLNIILTRNNDESLSPDERVSKKADLFISLHANGVYKGAKSPNGIMAITSNRQGNPLSTLLAGTCLAELGKLKGIAVSADVKTQRIKVLEPTTRPSTLLELGYMTNPSDLRFITNPDKQAEIALAIVNGIKQYQAKTK
ncbi:MAG: N-acetylmuramoyl-L-alanine amidase [Bacteroidota bacterium]